MINSDDKTPGVEVHEVVDDYEAPRKGAMVNAVEKTVEVAVEKIDMASKKAEVVAQKADKAAKKAMLLLWDELPEWMRDNQYIHTGYRAESKSFISSLGSILAIHNETVNIWTHMLAALSFFPIAYFLYTQVVPRYELARTIDIAVFACFFIGVGLCLAMSATYHAISNHSEPIMQIGSRFDYVGIIFDIWGSFIPSLYYGLIPVPWHVGIYWAMITIMGAGTLMVVLIPKFSQPEWRVLRTVTFTVMGLSGIAPVVHGLKIYGWAQMQKQMSIAYTLTQGSLYIIGGMIYASRIPERWAPGKFDIWGSSHQIFHMFIVVAGMVHLTGLLKAFDYNHSVRMGQL